MMWWWVVYDSWQKEPQDAAGGRVRLGLIQAENSVGGNR